MKELNFYVTNAEQINRKYAGKHIAIVDSKVVASGNDPKAIWEKAIKKCPKNAQFWRMCQRQT